MRFGLFDDPFKDIVKEKVIQLRDNHPNDLRLLGA